MSRSKRKAEAIESLVEVKSSKKSKSSVPNYDPDLAQLFASSLGPRRIVRKSVSQNAIPPVAVFAKSHRGGLDPEDPSTELATESVVTEDLVADIFKDGARGRRDIQKRKRNSAEDDLEARYMHQLALEEARDNKKLALKKEYSTSKQGMFAKTADDKPAMNLEEGSKSEDISTDDVEDEADEGVDEEPPQHETAAPNQKEAELEKSARTVFLANVSTSTITSKSARKILMDHLASFFPTLPKSNVMHNVESLRFRSTAFTNSGLPRKAAFVKRELMETTTKSTNAYAVYTTQVAAREATKQLNGTMVLDRHLRVDSVAHPAKQDHRRCVFVGNLGFVDDTSAIDAAKDEESNSKPRKAKTPADVEEGLWRQFGKAGNVESVRVVRDKTTRVGKGFAYVQFRDGNAVEKALLLNEKKFPPMLPRILRVTRAKNITRTKFPRDERFKKSGRKPEASKGPKKETQSPSKELKSLVGRANKLLGRAGAAQMNGVPMKARNGKKPTKNSQMRAQNFKNKAKEREC